MKKTAILLAILMALSSSAFGAFTAEEEVTLRQFINNKDRIVTLVQKSETLENIADGITNETIPLELAVLRAERVSIIAERNDLIDAVKATAIDDVNTIMDVWEETIDAQENLIALKEAELNA